jgi:transcriptional antiterminator RfaH
MYWCCAQIEQGRDRLAWHCLGLAGYKIYQPLLRESRRSHGRKIIATPPLFPGYLFVWIVQGFWWDARWSAGVRRLIMDGEQPARVPDAVISEIKSRERNGFVELPKARGLAPGMRVKVLQGPLQAEIGMLAALRPHERVLVLLNLLGGQQRVELAKSAIEVIE